MSEIITLSSDEEEVNPPPKKRIKPTPVEEVTLEVTPVKAQKCKGNDDVVILSDEEDYEAEVVKMATVDLKNTNKENIKCQVNTECNTTAEDDDNDSITFIDERNVKNNVNGVNMQDDSNSEKVSKNDESKIECSIIVDENSSEESSGKENKSQNASVSQINEPSTSADSHTILLENFLRICEESINSSQYEHLKHKQFPIIRKYYKKCGAKLGESSNFLKLLEENRGRAQKSPAAAVISFNEIFQYIKTLVDAESIEVSEEHRIKLKKLEKAIKLLVTRIKHLENSELNFEDEEDSTYLQLDRYANRLNKVYAKYCQLLKKNPHSGRITYEKLDFVDSEYNEINRAINKKYKNNKKFPSYIEMEEYIKKIVTEHKLELSEAKIRSESLRCFKKLGELLQSRRKKELYDSHYLYIRDSEDPANKDLTLESTLKQNFTDGQVKIEKICEEYVVKEEQGEEAALSEEDSDKSNYVDSEDEN